MLLSKTQVLHQVQKKQTLKSIQATTSIVEMKLTEWKSKIVLRKPIKTKRKGTKK